MSDAAIRVKGIGKRYRMRRAGSLKAAVVDLLRGRRGGNEFWALREASFEVAPGETLGIIGANGAGKSTLLSLLAGTREPTIGSVSTVGTVSSLLELGAGFHPDLTGRENVFLAGAIMGLSRATMVERFDAIAEFAGIGDFIDQPVKHYSSGMYVRLGFAVAVEVDPDILLIDEVLAVGDAEFQRKCIERMEDFRERGKTMLIISHDLPTIQTISSRILLLEQGQVLGIGDPEALVGQYESLNRKKNAKVFEREWGTGEARIVDVTFADAAGQQTDVFQFGQPLVATVHYTTEKRLEDVVFGFSIATQEGVQVYGNNTQIEGRAVPVIDGKGTITLQLDPVRMGPGTYLFSFSVHSADHKTNYHRLDNHFPVAVESEATFEGICHMPTKWSEASGS